MKRLLITCGLISAFAAFSQEMPPPGGSRGMNRVDFLAGFLDLTSAQKEQATAIFNAADEASTSLRTELSGVHDALRSAIKQGQPDAQLEQLAAKAGTLDGQMLAIQAKASAKFYTLLTADQKAKYDEMGNRRGGPGGGRMGPPRGR